TIPGLRWRPEKQTLRFVGAPRGGGGAPPVEILLALNHNAVDRFEVAPGFFLHRLALPAGSLAGSGYIPLEISSRQAANSTTTIAVGLEQFDLQSPGTPMLGADEGWYEPEYNPRTARAWR